jgi:outer membrane protein OmpA-like peptidoglycan-associated protein
MLGENLGATSVVGNKAAWQNSAALRVIDKLVDTRFSYKISAKLIMEVNNKFEFFANKTVYLLNDKNTIIKRTKSNPFGSFVFTDVKPGGTYLIGVDKTDNASGKVSLYTNSDDLIAPVDSSATTRFVKRFSAENNVLFNTLLVDDKQLKMDVKGKLFAENTNNPISDLKILLLNDKMEVMDTTTTDNFGNFIFRYVPYSSQITLTTFEKEQVLEAINNILVYSSEDEMIKIVSGIKNKRFNYKPLNTEQTRLSDVYADDPWLPLLNSKDFSKAKKGETIIENILFESDKYNLLPAAQKTLDKIALVMNANQSIKIELSAHTDAVATDTYNQTLSEQRAKAASDYIIGRGVDASRIIAKGYGETRILNHCKNGVFCSDDEHRVNRRIEFKILQD